MRISVGTSLEVGRMEFISGLNILGIVLGVLVKRR